MQQDPETQVVLSRLGDDVAFGMDGQILATILMTELAGATPDLTSSFTVLNHLFNLVGYNPNGREDPSKDSREEGYLFWIAWLQHNGAALFSTFSFVIEMTSREDLMNAISLNSSAFNCARIIGPSIAGFLMAHLGIALCFLFDGLSFIPVIAGPRT